MNPNSSILKPGQKPIGKPILVIIVVMLALFEILGIFSVIKTVRDASLPRRIGIVTREEIFHHTGRGNISPDELYYSVKVEGESSEYSLHTLKKHSVGDKVHVSLNTDRKMASEGIFDESTFTGILLFIFPAGIAAWWLFYWRKHRGY